MFFSFWASLITKAALHPDQFLCLLYSMLFGQACVRTQLGVDLPEDTGARCTLNPNSTQALKLGGAVF